MLDEGDGLRRKLHTELLAVLWDTAPFKNLRCSQSVRS